MGNIAQMIHTSVEIQSNWITEAFSLWIESCYYHKLKIMEIFFFAGIVLLLVILIILVLKRNGTSPVDMGQHKEVEALKIELARSQQREQSLLEERLMLRNELDKERENILVAERSLESTRSFYEAQLDKFQEQKNEIAEIKRQFNNEFQVIANKILEEKTQKFTETNHR